jgi:two-component system OmpR family response regulator
MTDDEIYGLSPRGEAELHSAATNLGTQELELLVRIDGNLTVGQQRAATATLPGDAFDLTLERLRYLGLIERVQLDTFALHLQAELDNFTLSSGGNEADAGVRSLQRSGYYVSIVRKPARALPPVAGRTLTAVIVEDDPQLARFVASFLGFAAFTVRIAGNRDEVQAEFRKLPIPDLVLLDVNLPDVNGFDVLASLRRHPAFRNVPVIMLTGKSTREAVLKGMALGADGYITKPFETDTLMSAVRTVLGRTPEAGKP